MNRNIKIHIPEYRRAVKDYNKKWQLTDEKLKNLCMGDCLKHNSMDIILTKVLLIGRGFATGIERHIQVNGHTGTQRAITLLARHLYRNRESMDNIISSIKDCNDLNSNTIKKISQAHGKLCKLLSKITLKGHHTVSFASKYLHFHNSCVPIYDQYANSQIKRWCGKETLLNISISREAEIRYFNYLKKVLQIKDEILNRKPDFNNDQRLKPTSRNVEYYAMWMAGRE